MRETKAERFRRLATKRVNSALKRIQLIGNLASPNYEFTKEQVKKIVETLREAINEVEREFNKRLGEKRAGFTL
jgi:adenosylmethionine-8-amino-7-oxononanoate aminotransferase